MYQIKQYGTIKLYIVDIYNILEGEFMRDFIKGVYIKVSVFEFISIIKYKDIKMVNEHNS